MNIDDYQVKRRFSIEEITEINLIIIYDLYYQRLLDLTVKDTIAMMFDLNYEGWSFHDWID